MNNNEGKKFYGIDTSNLTGLDSYEESNNNFQNIFDKDIDENKSKDQIIKEKIMNSNNYGYDDSLNKGNESKNKISKKRKTKNPFIKIFKNLKKDDNDNIQ